MTWKRPRGTPLLKRGGSLTTLRLGMTPVEGGVTKLILELPNDAEDFSRVSPECLVVLPEDADVTLECS